MKTCTVQHHSKGRCVQTFVWYCKQHYCFSYNKSTNWEQQNIYSYFRFVVQKIEGKEHFLHFVTENFMLKSILHVFFSIIGKYKNTSLCHSEIVTSCCLQCDFFKLMHPQTIYLLNNSNVHLAYVLRMKKCYTIEIKLNHLLAEG